MKGLSAIDQHVRNSSQITQIQENMNTKTMSMIINLQTNGLNAFDFLGLLADQSRVVFYSIKAPTTIILEWVRPVLCIAVSAFIVYILVAATTYID